MTNETAYQKTPFDGKKAIIQKGHPHAGATAVCLGLGKTVIGPGLVFRNENSGEEFFVFKPHEIKWTGS